MPINDTTQEIPYGYCACGCGQLTPIATKTRPKWGYVKGQPVKFIRGHNMLQEPLPESPNPSGLCMCGCGLPAPIAKRSDRQTGMVKGQPKRYIDDHKRSMPLTEKFWKYVDKNGPIHPVLLTRCWLWTGHAHPFGYGQITHEHKTFHAHRVSYELHFGSIPKGHNALHKCDNPPCSNPEHLFLGTHADNMTDKMRKGRGHGWAKKKASSK